MVVTCGSRSSQLGDLALRVSIFIEPHRGATYDDQLRLARVVEACGFDGLFRADHYQTVTDDDGLPGPTDSWVTLAGLARETSRIRLGTLVCSPTFRLPGVLAITVAQVDQMSGGRVELGMGAGWYAREHTSYGIPFPPVAERFDLLTEQLAIITGLWTTPIGQRFTYNGKHYTLSDAPALPKPVQTTPPIIIGGVGAKRTPRLAAEFADEYNVPFRSVSVTEQQYQRVIAACAEIGRDLTSRPLTLSAGLVVACGATDIEARRRAEPLFEKSALPPEDPVIGSAAQVVDRIAALSAVGVSRIHVRVPDMNDYDHIEFLAKHVLPEVSAM